MPENETLFHDARSANRWRPVCDRLDGGQTPTEAFPEIQNQLYSCLQRVWRQWKDTGVDPSQLFEAAQHNPGRLAELIRQTHFDSYAQLLRDVASGMQDATSEGLIRAFLDAAWDAARDELRLDCREDAQSSNFIKGVEAMLERMVRGLLNNPSRFPARPPRKDPPPDLDTQLGENLL
jgi:hypothetical protein